MFQAFGRQLIYVPTPSPKLKKKRIYAEPETNRSRAVIPIFTDHLPHYPPFVTVSCHRTSFPIIRLK